MNDKKEKQDFCEWTRQEEQARNKKRRNEKFAFFRETSRDFVGALYAFSILFPTIRRMWHQHTHTHSLRWNNKSPIMILTYIDGRSTVFTLIKFHKLFLIASANDFSQMNVPYGAAHKSLDCCERSDKLMPKTKRLEKGSQLTPHCLREAYLSTNVKVACNPPFSELFIASAEALHQTSFQQKKVRSSEKGSTGAFQFGS